MRTHCELTGRARRAAMVAGLALTLTGCGDAVLEQLANDLLAGKAQGKALVAGEAADLQAFHGRLDTATPYMLFELGPSLAGERWRLSLRPATGVANQFVLALFDTDSNLLWRDRLTSRGTVDHVLRSDTDRLYVGVTATGGQTLDFDLTASRATGGDAPQPQAQVVWLNFTGGSDVHISSQPPETFGAFAATDLGPAYAGDTELLKTEIARTMRAQFAEYNVTILSSDDGPEPMEPHATVHFGGVDSRFLGLGEDVDRYNEDPSDQAIVYTQDFAAYAVMRLKPEDEARMVANVASHELGHLLGLYHTRGAEQLMDDSQSAWDLVGELRLDRAPLAETVFPFGMEDCARVLAEAVGQAQ